jgi:hypothetical protein
MIFKNIFAEKFSKKLAFLTQNKAKLYKNLIITLVFEKNANFFAENCRKSQKIVIIASTPGPHHRFSFVTVSTTDDPDKPVMTALGFLGRLPGGKSTPKPPQQGLNP